MFLARFGENPMEFREAVHPVSTRVLLIGQVFGNYRLDRPIGRGAFATVFLGRHQYLDRDAAIKILHHRADDYEKQLFSLEARLAATLVHPNIVRVLEYGQQFGRPFLVMDYAPGGSLWQYRDSRLPLPVIVRYARQAARGLDYLNKQRVIHCDIKPQNLLLGQGNRILIGDFGIALLASSRATEERIIRGTPRYMAPEQIMGRPGFATDQYALAVVLYELLCGAALFDGTRTEIIDQHLRAEPPLLSERGLYIPGGVEAVIRKALAKDPRKRYESAGQFVMALERAAHESPRTILTPPRERKLRYPPVTVMEPVSVRRHSSYPHPKKTRRFAFAVLCFGHLVAAALIWFLSTLPISNTQVLAWLVAFWLLGCMCIGALITTR